MDSLEDVKNGTLSENKRQGNPNPCPQARFTSTNQPPNRGRKKGVSSPTDWLRKLSKVKINFHNPITDKDEKREVSLVVAIQLILKATQDSDLPSIREYFDRIDGKLKDNSIVVKTDVTVENNPSGNSNTFTGEDAEFTNSIRAKLFPEINT